MLRRKVSFDNITRYLFCAGCLEEEEMYQDDDYLARNLNIENLSQFVALIFITENLEISNITKTKLYLLDKKFAAENYKKLTEYKTNKNTETVFLYYKLERFKSINDLLSQSGQGNLVLLLSEEPNLDILNKLSEIFIQEECIIFYKSFGDRIFDLYKKLIATDSVKYIMHYTTGCRYGTDNFANGTIDIKSFDVVNKIG